MLTKEELHRLFEFQQKVNKDIEEVNTALAVGYNRIGYSIDYEIFFRLQQILSGVDSEAYNRNRDYTLQGIKGVDKNAPVPGSPESNRRLARYQSLLDKDITAMTNLTEIILTRGQYISLQRVIRGSSTYAGFTPNETDQLERMTLNGVTPIC